MRSPRRRCYEVFLAALLACASEQRASAEATFHPTPELTLSDLTRVIRQRSAALQVEQLNVETAEAEEQQSHLLGNPVVDLGWGTIPIGPTNPKNLSSPMLHVPNYTVGLSYTFLIGKRRARQQRAAALTEAARAGRDAVALEQAIQLARALGQMATGKLRQEGQKGLLEQAKGSIEVARNRLDAGQGTPLDVDRLEIEQGRIEQQTQGAEGEEREALAACSALAGTPCAPFASGAEARSYLQNWIDRASALTGEVERRADLRALEAQQRAAQHEGTLARASSKPDITVRFGYTYDTFLISGNQNHSLSLQLAVPLPIFDRGQAWVAATNARQMRLEATRRRVVDAERARIEPLRRALESQRQRQATISSRLLPRANAALTDLERAASSRLLPVTEVIQARRTINELLIEEADSFGDAYQAALGLFSVLPPASQPEASP